MNRYPKSSSNKRFDGKRVQLTTSYPTIPVSPNDVYITSKETDFLDALAQKYYRDATLWWIIARANGIAGTMIAPIGKQLRIPMNTQSVLSRFFNANTQS